MASYEAYYEQIKNQTAADRQAAKDKSNKIFENQKAVAKDQFSSQVKETTSAYNDNYRMARIQKATNERQIAENMAKMGLTDSGLNRTQITANQLSYGNTIGNLNTALQKATDALALALRGNLTTIENNRIQKEAEIDNQFDKYASDAAADMYKADVAAASRVYSNNNNKSTPATKYTFSRKNGNTVVYYDESGKEKTFGKGINPYTGNNTGNSQAAKKYGTWNYYQPKGVIYDGIDYGKVSSTGYTAIDDYGLTKNIFFTKTNGQENVWIWDDYNDRYKNINEEWAAYKSQ